MAVPGWVLLGRMSDSRSSMAAHAVLLFLIVLAYSANFLGFKIPISLQYTLMTFSAVFYLAGKAIYGARCPQLLKDTDGDLEAFSHYRELVEKAFDVTYANEERVAKELELTHQSEIAEVKSRLSQETSLSPEGINTAINIFMAAMAAPGIQRVGVDILNSIKDPSQLDKKDYLSRVICSILFSLCWLCAGINIIFTAVFVVGQLDLANL